MPFQIARELLGPLGRFSGSRNLANQRVGDGSVCCDLYRFAKVGHLKHCYVEHVERGDFVGFIPGRRYGCRLLCSRRRERPSRSRSTDSGNKISPHCVDCYLPLLIRFLLCRSASMAVDGVVCKQADDCRQIGAAGLAKDDSTTYLTPPRFSPATSHPHSVMVQQSAFRATRPL
jgi:hypothetical protein